MNRLTTWSFVEAKRCRCRADLRRRITFSRTRGLVRVLGPIVQSLVLAMLDVEPNIIVRRRVPYAGMVRSHCSTY